MLTVLLGGSTAVRSLSCALIAHIFSIPRCICGRRPLPIPHRTPSLIKKRVRAATPSSNPRQILSVSVERLSPRSGCRTSLRYISAYSSQDVSYFGWEMFVHKILCVSLIHSSDSGFFFFGDKGVCEKPQNSCMLNHLPPGPQDMFLGFWGVVPGFHVLFELRLVTVVSFTDLNLLALGNPINQPHRLS